MKNIPELFAEYLRLIGINKNNHPKGIKGLEEIVLKHLCKVPFENVSKLLLFGKEGRGRPFTLSEFLNGIKYQDLGGTCHSNNPFFANLLTALGYKASLLGADMSEPNVHTCIRVKIESSEYHVDVAYAAPFRKPMKLDCVPYEITHGNYRYLFDRLKEKNKYEVALFSGKERLDGYIVHGPPRTKDFFRKTTMESFEMGRTFMSCLRITRFFKNHTVELKDKKLIYHKDGKSSQQELKNLADIELAVQNNLLMPRCPIKKAIKILEQVSGKSFF